MSGCSCHGHCFCYFPRSFLSRTSFCSLICLTCVAPSWLSWLRNLLVSSFVPFWFWASALLASRKSSAATQETLFWTASLFQKSTLRCDWRNHLLSNKLRLRVGKVQELKVGREGLLSKKNQSTKSWSAVVNSRINVCLGTVDSAK